MDSTVGINDPIYEGTHATEDSETLGPEDTDGQVSSYITPQTFTMRVFFGLEDVPYDARMFKLPMREGRLRVLGGTDTSQSSDAAALESLNANGEAALEDALCCFGSQRQ